MQDLEAIIERNERETDRLIEANRRRKIERRAIRELVRAAKAERRERALRPNGGGIGDTLSKD